MKPIRNTKSKESNEFEEPINLSKESKKNNIRIINEPLEPLEDLVSSDSEIEYKNPVVKEQTQQIKPKRQLTEKQIIALQQGRIKARETINNRNNEINEQKNLMKLENARLKEELELQKRKHFEDKIVKKAISIKKKQIKSDILLDEISDDDDDSVEIKEALKLVKQAKQKIEQQKLNKINKPIKQELPPPPPPTPQISRPKYYFI
jgi:hypothetical protein